MNAVANSFVLYLWHDFYNRTFKIKLYIALQSVPQWKFGAHTWFQRMNMIKWMVFSEISNKLRKCKCCSSIWCPTFRDWYWFVFNVNIFMEVNSAKKLSDFLKSGELYDCRFLFEIHVWCTEESQRIIHSGKLVFRPAFELSISEYKGGMVTLWTQHLVACCQGVLQFWCIISVCIWVIYSTGNEFSFSRLFAPSDFGELDNYRLSIKYMCIKIR